MRLYPPMTPTGAQDAARQAASGEARVIGVNQDASAMGAPDAASEVATLKGRRRQRTLIFVPSSPGTEAPAGRLGPPGGWALSVGARRPEPRGSGKAVSPASADSIGETLRGHAEERHPP